MYGARTPLRVESDGARQTPEMQGMTPAERAALYKQRAAAAGIGQPPNPAGAVRPSPPSPRRRLLHGTDEQGSRRRTCASRGAPGVTATMRRAQVAAVARREPAATANTHSERLVYVWPHLVTIEVLSAMLLLLSLVVVSIILQAPLEAHANPDRTPNPSKAPWYFLNLQELLIHMHPSLAGVLIPAGRTLRRDSADPLHRPQHGRRRSLVRHCQGQAICVFTSVYTTIVLIALILFDDKVGVKPMMQALATDLNAPILADTGPFGVGALSLPNVWVSLTMRAGSGLIFVLDFTLLAARDGSQGRRLRSRWVSRC